MKSNNQRLVWADWMKCIGILLVVFAHCDIGHNLKTVIYSFHMPVFFILSGYLSGPVSDKKRFIKRNLNGLLAPFLIYNLITIPLKVDSLSGLTPGLFFTGFSGVLPFAGPTWFLLTLFAVRMTDLLPLSRSNYKMLIAGSMLLFIIPQTFIEQLRPFKGDYILLFTLFRVLMALPFYLIGKELRRNGRLDKVRQFNRMAIISGIAILTIVAGLWNGKTDMFSVDYGRNYILFSTTGVAGFIMLYAICISISRTYRIVENISQGTILIMGLHLTIISSVNKWFAVYEYPTITGVLITSVIVLTLYPLILIARRRYPLLIGKS